MAYVSKSIMKKDAMALITGKPVYTEDLAPADCLVVKVLRSPHAHALVKEIKTDIAKKVPGIECVLTYKDVPQNRFTQAGQTYPEPSPYDRYILDQRVRFVGDAVAIVAGVDEKCVDRALKMIKVEYEVLEPVLDFRTAKDNPVLVHPEEDWIAHCPVGADNKRNLVATGSDSNGDVEAKFAECDLVLERTYHTKANCQTMMETFRSYAYMDLYGRLTVVSSTQIPFHNRRILGNALGIPKSKIRIIKPRVGGGFGAKQTGVAEVYPAIVTWLTGKPSKIVFSRKEAMIAGSPRHEMEVTVKIGLNKDGQVKALRMYTLSNTGAFGEHGPTTVGLSGHKALPIYTPEVYEFVWDVVYTNMQAAGAYRGYGATQGLFAVESILNEAADLLEIDPLEIRRKNFVQVGQRMPAYYNELLESCAVEECMDKCRELIGWDEKYPSRNMGNGKVRAVGVGISMQGSGISNVDVGSVTIRVSDEGHYNLMIGAADMGTGCDTTLAQIAADCLDCDVDDIIVYGVDTDISPYDSGSYASSTAYVTGNATIKACTELRQKICAIGARMLEVEVDAVDFDGAFVFVKDDIEKKVTLKDVSTKNMTGCELNLDVSASHTSPKSPPPFMASMAEVEVDTETGEIKLVDFVSCVDCGTPINPALVKIQVEGGVGQGIGMALYEDVTYTKRGMIIENSFMQYKIPSRVDLPTFRTEIAKGSYEPTGPFGVKSVGEVVINTASPAIAHAVANATGVRVRELPITPEKILKGLHKIGE